MPYNNGYNAGGYNRSNSNSRSGSAAVQETTRGNTLYNNKAGKFLDIGFWGSSASIQINSVAPGGPMDWNARKNAARTSANLGYGDLNDLWDVSEEVMDMIKATGTFTSSAIRVGSKRDTIVELNNGSSIGMAAGIYLVIYKNVDSSNRTNNLDIYPFNKSHVLRGYDHSSGNAKDDFLSLGQFKKFYRFVKEAAKAFTMATAHTSKQSFKNDTMTMFKALAGITGKLGIDMGRELDIARNNDYGNRPSYSNNGGGGGSSYGGGYNQVPSMQGQPSQVFSSIDDPVDINLDMNNLSKVNLDDFK